MVTAAPMLPGTPASTTGREAAQLALIGQPQPIRVPERLWRSWLDDPTVVARFEAKTYRRPGGRCGSAASRPPGTAPSVPRACPACLDVAPCPRTLVRHEDRNGALGLRGRIVETHLDLWERARSPGAAGHPSRDRG